MRRAAALLLPLLVLAACTAPAPPPAPPPSPGPPTTLRVLAGSELQDMQPILDAAAAATGVTVQMTFTGSLDAAQAVADGKADGVYDALWFSSTRYLESIPEAKRRLAATTRAMGSPVVLGVRASVATRLGWDRNPVSWTDIAAAAGSGAFTFAMSDPAASNSGFSALVAVASALDGTGRVLDTAAIDEVAPALIGFFSGQQLTAGSSAWLTDAFVRRSTGADPGPALDGLINYESSLIELDRSRKLPEPLTLVYPRDGLVSADYPLTLLAGAPDPAREAHQRLSAYLQRPEVQRSIVERTARRPAVPDVAGPPNTPNVVELPFPASRTAIEALLSAYFDRLRRPARTAYVLDVSGSMAGPRIAALKAALTGLTGVDTSLTGQFCRFRSREEITLLPFNQRAGAPKAFTIDVADPQRTRDTVRAAIGGLQAAGDTAVYDGLIAAASQLAAVPDPQHYLSIVLMTDGESNTGKALGDFTAFAASRPTRIPVFPILFGEAAQAQMQEVATATGGQVFDARAGDLAHAFCEIRGYQ